MNLADEVNELAEGAPGATSVLLSILHNTGARGRMVLNVLLDDPVAPRGRRLVALYRQHGGDVVALADALLRAYGGNMVQQVVRATRAAV